jgi:hypothetical protein
LIIELQAFLSQLAWKWWKFPERGRTLAAVEDFTHQLSTTVNQIEIFLSRQAIVCVVFPVFAIITEESAK